ncbi:hypothetical protein PCASD_25819 [Puccinia coronata f. sp. avenae]|uniref:Uncharacterized protein n=1 Tax=Puccinia coronata f. sp. avenae TaxID=200324 RepID=A0A2N5TIB5_9BASI|nr:hypothetical protein PCASD_25819 [Puccinia coronata f. sp. avenae]
MLSTASHPIGDKDNLPKRHTAWPNLQPQNIEAARGSNPHQKHQAAGLGTTAGAELLPTPGRSCVAPSRPVAELGRYRAACERLSLGPACDDSGYRRSTVAHPCPPRDLWQRRGGMGTSSGTVSQVVPPVRFTQSCDQAGTTASLGRALSWEIVPLCGPPKTWGTRRPRAHMGIAKCMIGAQYMAGAMRGGIELVVAVVDAGDIHINVLRWAMANATGTRDRVLGY